MRRYLRIGSLVLAAVVVTAPAAAQDAEEGGSAASTGDDGLTARWTAEFGYWVSQPLGLDYDAATRSNPTNAFDTVVLQFPEGTNTRPRVRAGYRLKDNLGEFVVTYWSQADLVPLAAASPGRFRYGELAVLPPYAGVFDDGLADGFEAETITSSRDFRIDFYRIAAERKRLRLRWMLGFRRVYHERRFAAAYYAFAPNIPPPLQGDFGQERPDLEPSPDRADSLSKFEGRGIEAGLEARIALAPGGRVWFETGFAIAGLRGDLTTEYASTTHLYVEDDGDGNEVVLTPPYDEFGDPSRVANISQRSIPIGIKRNASASAAVVDAFGEIRWNAWKTIELFAGFRNLRYADVGADVRPTSVGGGLNGVLNSESVSTTKRSAIYEGFYFGAAAHF